MEFNSYLFVLFYLPLVVCGFYVVGRLDRPIINRIYLICASLLFYWYSQQAVIIFLFISIIFNFAIQKAMMYFNPKVLLGIGIIANVGALGYIKYLNFGIELSNIFLNTHFSVREVVVPLGISFITFQQIDFLVNVYKNTSENLCLDEYAAGIVLFPHLTQGPIFDSKSFIPMIRVLSPKINWDNMAMGITVFAMGLAKKTLLADLYGPLVNVVYADLSKLNLISAIYVSLAYSLQIYFDFSGYCDMAMGIGMLLNIEIPINFNSPYKARNILEFWDRWHITLTSFLTKYVYIPLGGNRRGNARTYVNILIVFLISGLWHGASITFVIWGLLHGLATVLTRLFKSIAEKIPVAISRILTFAFVTIAWIPFRAGSFGQMKDFIGGMRNSGYMLEECVSAYFSEKYGSLSYVGSSTVAWVAVIIGLLIVFVAPNTMEMAKKKKYNMITLFAITILLVLSVISTSTGTTTYVYMDF